jgi:pectate lyase
MSGRFPGQATRCLIGTLIFALGGVDLSAQPPAFPGAQGFGAAAFGGRGGQVIYVTNLDTSGPGSFQAALDTPGPRYILFKVSGLIDGPVHLLEDDVTIAGQTSPGGIIVRGFHTTEEPFCDQDPVCIQTATTAENWILRHVRLRPGDDGGGLDDGLRLLHTRNAIVDHVSVANATDEAVQVSFANDLTLQYSSLAETLGGHAPFGGMLLNYSDPGNGWELSRLSIHHNVWSRLLGRFPEMSRESPQAGGTILEIELSNNLLWDPGYFIDVANESYPGGGGISEPIYYRMNWVGNFAHARPDFPYGMIDFREPLGPSPTTTTFWQDNRINLYPALADYQLRYCCNDFPPSPLPTTPSWASATRHPFPPITYHAGTSLRSLLGPLAGALPHDPMDRRLTLPLANGVLDPAPRDTNPYGDAFDFDWTMAPPAPLDSDNDGMPNSWEIAHGLNPSVQDHNGLTLSLPITGVAGYTNLEVYLNQLADQLAGAALFADGFESGSTSAWSAVVP